MKDLLGTELTVGQSVITIDLYQQLGIGVVSKITPKGAQITFPASKRNVWRPVATLCAIDSPKVSIYLLSLSK